MKKFKPKTNSKADSDDLEKMREHYKKQKNRRGEGDDEPKDNDWFNPPLGISFVRFMPYKKSKFYLEAPMHFKVGPNAQTVRCIGTLNEKGFPPFDTICPICRTFLKEQQRVNAKYERGSEKGKKAWIEAKEKFCPRQRYFANVITKDGALKKFSFGEQILEQLLEYWFGEEAIGDFTDPENGRWMKIKRIGKTMNDRQTKYKVFKAEEEAIDDWEEVKSKRHDLQKAAGELLSKDAIKQILEGLKDDEDADDDDEDDDEPKSRSSKSKKRRASKEDDDDESGDDDDDASGDDDDEDADEDEDGDDSDDDGDSDEDDEDEDGDEDVDDEEEDDEPPSKKASLVKKKLKNKSR